MKELLFEGKRVDNGEWVEGFYYEDMGYFIKEKPSSVSTGTYLVIPETVRQFTNKNDRNGQKIFEGDIIQHIDDNGNIYLYTIRWREYMFEACYDHGELTTALYKWWEKDIVVVGNIYDNPELLRSGANE